MKRTYIIFAILVAACYFLIACGGVDQNVTLEEPETNTGSQVEEPTNVPTNEPTVEPTVEPTEVLVEESTDEPVNSPDDKLAEADDGSFRDDFDEGLHESWSWINEDASRWQIVEDDAFNGLLQISADNPPIAPETTDIPIVNLLTRPIPMGIDIVVTTHLVATDPDENFEQASLFLIEDGDSYVLVNLGFCSFCTNKSIYLETSVDGIPLFDGIQSLPVTEDQTEVWLRLEYNPNNNVCVALVAFVEGEWQRVGQIVRNAPAFTMVAIGAANVPGPDSNPDDDLIATFDFLEIKVYE